MCDLLHDEIYKNMTYSCENYVKETVFLHSCDKKCKSVTQINELLVLFLI